MQDLKSFIHTFHPPFPHKDLQHGLKLVEEGEVGSIVFSEGTYQVEIHDEMDTYWPFLQCRDDGQVTDCFCTCKHAEKRGSCEHLSAAFLSIYKDFKEPLHVRFRSSFWNHLMRLGAKRHGYETKCLKKLSPKGFACEINKKRLFSIKPLTKQAELLLGQMLLKRPKETEETSLKFSNLPAEELALWREGRPSHQLQYELSFWADIAKWLLSLQEAQKKYEVKFKPQEHLPKEIIVKFRDVEISMYIAEVNWNELITSLGTIESSLKVYPYQELIFKGMTYQKEDKAFYLDTEVRSDHEAELFHYSHQDEDVLDLGYFVFRSGLGFFAKNIDPLLKLKKISSEHVAQFLVKHAALVKCYLKQEKIDLAIHKASYQLFFDEAGDFHIRCYLFEPGDLQTRYAAHFGAWVYVEDKGFFQLGNVVFSDFEKIVPSAKMSQFISRHRLWLSKYDGFQTHLTKWESFLSYEVSDKEELKFKSFLEHAEDAKEVMDIGEWIYIKGKGFYAKSSSRGDLVLKPGLTLHEEKVSAFIDSNLDELEYVKDFFSHRQPIANAGVEISLDHEDRICVYPHYQFNRGYNQHKVILFGSYSYVKGEGFSAVPKQFHIPKAYRKKTVIPHEEEEEFLSQKLSEIPTSLILKIDPRLKKPKHLKFAVVSIEKNSKRDKEWVIGFEIQSELGKIPIEEVLKAIKASRTYIKSNAGLLHLSDPLFNWLRQIPKSRISSHYQMMFSALDWIKLQAQVDIEALLSHDPLQWEEFLSLSSMQAIEELDTTGLQSELRAYQEAGVKWLWWLYTFGLSGLLCDEMGLGKTHQAMGLLAAAHNHVPDKKYLVVCPTSVVYHWEDLLKRFLPHMGVLVYYGIERSLENFREDKQILLTSYGTLRSEKESFSEMGFEIAILDELQVAKNNHSQTHRSLKHLKAHVKIGLTGTPIENRLMELHALFDIILPSYMPPQGQFKELFVQPIEKDHDPEKKKLLTKLIHPFILRRKKEEVLHELPEKIEEIAYVRLSLEQKQLYQEAFMKQKEAIEHKIVSASEPIPYLHIFSLFNTLKQICDHPCLINKDFEHYERYPSGKWELFVELLSEARESGQKVVVFSQYLHMLDIMELYLSKHNIGYAQIRGSTRDRKEEMRRFKEDKACEVFLGSLQAAGVGIDLVSASVVIHYDRWWNPARENQATDRVHRIGQNRGVQVFKLVSRDTIEEHIHAMIESKLHLLHNVVGYDDQDQIKHLQRDELLELLNLLEKDIKQESKDD